jgi:hypothetical protein
MPDPLGQVPLALAKLSVSPAHGARQIQAPELGSRKLKYRATGRLSRDN